MSGCTAPGASRRGRRVVQGQGYVPKTIECACDSQIRVDASELGQGLLVACFGRLVLAQGQGYVAQAKEAPPYTPLYADLL